MRRPQGVTLLELAFALALLAILLGFAVPGFQQLRLDSQRTAAVNDLLHGLYLARSEAIKRGAVVSICPGDRGTGCASADQSWDQGWVIFENIDRDRPPQLDVGEPVLELHAATPGLRITSNRPAFSYRPVTQADANGTFVFCDSRGSPEARAIIVSHTGRPRVSSRDASGRPLACALDSP